MKIKINIIISILAFVLFLNVVSAALNVSLADHGSNIKNKSSGAILTSGNLRIEVYSASSGGTLIYNETFASAIVNGSWNVMLGENSSNPLSLEFGKIYYKDYLINGENVNFTNLTGSNVDRQFFYAPLGDIGGEDINQSTNITASWFIGNINGTGTVYAQSTKNLSLGYDFATNGTLISWVNAINGTLASTIAANTFGNFNQTFNSTTLFLWSLLNRIGIGTTSPQNVLNVLGDINATTTVFSQGKNLSLGYDYALNASSSGISWTNAINGTLLNYTDALNGTLALNSSLASYVKTINWNSTNTSYVSWANAINGTLLNYTDALNGTLALNSSLASYVKTINWNSTNTSYVSWANAINGTLLNYTDALNNTLMQQANWNATNTSYYLATNPFSFYNSTNPPMETLWNANYSTFLTHVTWATANNGTLLNYSNALNGTLALNSSLADYVKTVNWNSTNTTYRTTTNNTFVSFLNVSLNNVSFQAGAINITSNSTCVKIYGATSILEVC